MDEKDLDYTAIRRRVARRFRKRLIFFVHFSLFVLYALYCGYVLFSPIR